MNDSEPSAAMLTELLSATAAADASAFERLYALTSPQLYAITLRLLNRRDWAEDALQDCYLRIWQKAESYTPERGTPMAWLATIARYRALDLLRARRPEVSESEQPIADAPDDSADSGSPEQRAAELQGMDRLDECMEGLQQDHRQLIVLAYFEGFTHAELARRFKAPMGSIKTWLRRGLLSLRDCLGVA